ncbi:MAG: class II fructose-bisphosphate aldolase [Lentisphaerae bacterium]|nr:class II fructose-bisphosphate aldolase [Lentisphaerota bacterium]
MPLFRMDDLMIQARKHGAALGAFECWDSLNVRGIAMAAKRCNSAVIFQATPLEYNLMGGADALADIVNFYVNKYDIAAALHLDHGSTLKHVDECLKSGFTSVMLDASVYNFEKNAELSAQAAAMAAGYNASCEAELGHVGGGGDGGANSESVLTVPEEAAEFVRRTKVDCLAVAIGTVHGDYAGKPELRLDRLEKIAASVDVPLVLHGGSGTPKDLLQKAIKLGIAKINICTDINKAFLAAIEGAKGRLAHSVPGTYYIPAVDAVADKTEEMIKLFRCEI